MNNQKTILIYKNENGWMARFCDDSKIKKDIPTPFTPSAEAESVIKLLRSRNPGYLVRVAGESELFEKQRQMIHNQ